MNKIRVLITGISGFIGVNFLKYFYLHRPQYEIIGLDSFRHKGEFSRLDYMGFAFDPYRVKILRHDLNVPIDRILAYKIGKVDYIINLASDSAVERSVKDPGLCWFNNVNLIYNMLEYARRCLNLKAFIQISTDEVYGDWDSSLHPDGHAEWSKIIPSNPYSASKAAQEALCIAYWRTYKVPVVLCNTMNNIGEYQDPEKFLPRIVRSLYRGETVPIYSDNGKCGTRVYLDAMNHAFAVDFLLGRMVTQYQGIDAEEVPDRWNICGEIELDNLEVAKLIAERMGIELKYELVQSHSMRPGYDKKYKLNPAKLLSTGFKYPYSWDNTIDRIIEFYKTYPEWATA